MGLLMFCNIWLMASNQTIDSKKPITAEIRILPLIISMIRNVLIDTSLIRARKMSKGTMAQ